MREFEDLLILVCQYFNDRSIEYTVRGGIAILFQGRFRTTENIDFILYQKKFVDNDFIEFCKQHELSVDPYDLIEGKSDNSQITIMDFPNSIRIDLKFATSKWELDAVSNSETFHYKGHSIKICSPEYLIANKLYKGSNIDIEDAYSVYFQNKDRINKDTMNKLIKYFKIEKKIPKIYKKILNNNFSLSIFPPFFFLIFVISIF